MGRQALKTGVAIGEDVLSGKNVKTASTNRLREAVGSMTEKRLVTPNQTCKVAGE